MIIFRYDPITVMSNVRGMFSDEAYQQFFPEHHKWLTDNDIDYCVNVFTWPEFFLIGNRPGLLCCEFTITIENDNSAIMFKLYSGVRIEA